MRNNDAETKVSQVQFFGGDFAEIVLVGDNSIALFKKHSVIVKKIE